MNKEKSKNSILPLAILGIMVLALNGQPTITTALSGDNTVNDNFNPGVCVNDVNLAGEWLSGQQNEETGLLRSYDMPGDCMAWTYDQAAGIMALLGVGDVNTATKCVDGMMAIWREPNDPNDPNHVWIDGYDSSNGKEEANSIAVGPNAWMGLALLKLYQVSGNNEYLTAAKDVAKFILKLQAKQGCAEGSIAGGYNEDGEPFSWTSTEHNVDAMAFLLGLAEATDVNAEDYRSAAYKVAKWLDQEMWDANVGYYYYYTGYADNNECTTSDFPERLDSQTWTLLALQAMANCDSNEANITALIHNGLPWIDQFLYQVSYEDCNLFGFAKVTLGERATNSFWAEGTAGYILAADAACHSRTKQEVMRSSLRCLQNPTGSIPYSVGITCPEIHQYFDACDIILAHFEAHPHCLYGQLGVYGDGAPDWEAIKDANFAEPYSWYYEPEKPGYDSNNVHTGWQSFRLVNATDMCMKQDGKWVGWASFGLDLGPTKCDVMFVRDVSAYREFVFWAKTDNIDGANIKVLFRDALSECCTPQVRIDPTPHRLGNEWQEHVVQLDAINGVNELHLSLLVHVGLAFGMDVENEPNTIIYVDDMGFRGSETMTYLSNGAEMPAVFPQHWPYGSVAATAWSIFAENKINPFAVVCEGPLTPCLPVGDFDEDCIVDFTDFSIFSLAWLTEPAKAGWNPFCDISNPADNYIDRRDLAVLVDNWLAGL